MAELLEQIKILHVPGAHLDDVHAHLEHLDVVGGHDLRHNGQSGGRLGLLEETDPLVAHALEGVR